MDHDEFGDVNVDNLDHEEFGDVNVDNLACASEVESSECEESDAGESQEVSFQDCLATWAANFNIQHVALSELLKILNKHGMDVPNDPRTLLSTPKDLSEKDMCGGKYIYIGVAKTLSAAMKKAANGTIFSDGTSLTIDINIDGIPLFKSSNGSLWHVLGAIREAPECGVLTFALFFGKQKPTPLDEYLSDFITEMKEMLQSGLKIGDIHFNVSLGAFVCDAPARAYVKCVKGHAGYGSCERCRYPRRGMLEKWPVPVQCTYVPKPSRRCK